MLQFEISIHVTVPLKEDDLGDLEIVAGNLKDILSGKMSLDVLREYAPDIQTKLVKKADPKPPAPATKVTRSLRAK